MIRALNVRSCALEGSRYFRWSYSLYKYFRKQKNKTFEPFVITHK